MALFAGFFFSIPLNAQTDGFFRSYDDYQDRDATINDNGGIDNYGIGQTVPLSSGILVLVAAGAGYAAMKRKRSSIKILSLLLACVMLITFTNCKKKLPTISPSDAAPVYITLNLGDGSKVQVTPGFEDPETHEIYAKVTFEAGDRIYVGNNGKYCGYLDYTSTGENTGYFSGTVTPESENDYLHFYFMGNKTPLDTVKDKNNKIIALNTMTPTDNTTVVFSVNITDQTVKYPVISYSRSTEKYKSGTTSYSAKLRNYCSIVKFNITNDNIPESNAVSITANNNIVTVNFGANNYATSTTGDPYTYSKYGEGDITLHAVDGHERWAILVPQVKVNYAQASATGCFSVNSITIPQIQANEYNPTGINVGLVQPVPGAFCIGPNYDDQVFFAPGNLQLTRESTSVDWSTGQWSFKANQYDYDPASGNDGEGTNYASATVISHFCWGTSGWNNTTGTGSDPLALNYLPQCTDNKDYSKDNAEHATNPHHYGPSNKDGKSVDITGTNWDWGVYHSEGGAGSTITNGGGYSWRTPTNNDMKFILGPNITVAPSFGSNTRRSATVNGVPNARFAKATLSISSKTIKGLLIFPDGYVHPQGVGGPDHINEMTVGWDANTYDSDDWSLMREAGVVFLPGAGSRETYSDGKVKIHSIDNCYYWTSSADPKNYNPKEARNVRVGANDMVPDSQTSRTRGCCVRLVRDIPKTPSSK